MKRPHDLRRLALGAALLLLFAGPLVSQSSSSFNPLDNSINTPRPFDPGTNTTNPSALAVQAQNPFLGSVPLSRLVPGNINLSLSDAVNRGLRANLGLIDSEQQHARSRAMRIRALSTLLPQLATQFNENFQNFPVNTIGGQKLGLPALVPNYTYQLGTMTLRQAVVDVAAWHEEGAAKNEEAESRAAMADARNIVVLAATSAYLEVLASQSRVTAAQANLASAQALEALVQDRVKHEVSPQIDSIRATVARESAEERLALIEVRLAKDKLGLSRIIGMPLEQEFTLTSELQFHPAPAESIEALVRQAVATRQDLSAASAKVQQAEQLVKSRRAQRLPSLDIRANGGEIGVNFGHVYGTYDVEGELNLPIFTGRRIEADILEAQADLHQRQAEFLDLQQRTQFDVRSAVLDLQAADKSVEVARANHFLANEGLRQARDRFDVGVSNSLEVIEAEQALATAQDNDIDSIYSHNLAKLMLIRSLGTAERDYPLYLQAH